MKDINMKAHSLLPQTLISNRYQITEKLGSGGMGIVYLVKDILKDNRLNALKIIRKDHVDETVLESFRQEFEVMTRLKHPNLAQVYDFGFDKREDSYYITMEYIQGISLKELLRKKRNIPEEIAIDIIIALCRTLAFIHSRKIFHIDIKPGNIMLNDAIVKVLDFGLADLEKPEDYKTKGTLLYMAPEVLIGKISRQTDIYAIGLIFYELLTGKSLFPKSGSGAVISILKNKREFTKHKNRALQKIENPGIRTVIAVMLKYNPEDRYHYCSEIIHDINTKLEKDYVLETLATREAYVLGAGFVGRQDELSKLKLKLKYSSPHKMLLVKGKAGIGKSRLFREFRNWCQLKNIPFLEADCSEKFSKTFGPFLDILNEVLLKASPGQIDRFGPELKKILPDHDQFKDIETAPSLDLKIERGILIQNINHLLLDCSKKHESIAIYLNDLHWADEGSLEVLEELLYMLSFEENRESSLRLYVDAREEEMGKIDFHLDKFRKKQRIEEICLHPFNKDHVGNYIDAIFGENNIAESLKDAVPEICTRVGGNPFFLQELIRSLVENEYIAIVIFKWKLIKLVGDLKIPGTLKSILQKRLSKLSLKPQEMKALQHFALFNKEVSVHEFDQLTDGYIKMNSEEFFNEMERRELFTFESVDGDLKYGFAHSLIREIVEQDVQDKQKIHLQIAGRLEEIHKSDIDGYMDDLAYHYSRTNDRERAMLYLEKAGDSARVSYTNEKAISYYDQLLMLLDKDEKEKRIKILCKQSKIFDLTGRWDEGREVLNNALKLAEKIGIAAIKGNLLNQLGIFLMQKGNYSRAMDCYEEKMKIAEQLGNRKGASSALGNMGNIYFIKGDYIRSMECYEKQLKISEELGDKTGTSSDLGNMGAIYLLQGDYSRALKYYKKRFKTSKKLGDNKGISIAVGNMGIVYYQQGNFSCAMDCYKEQLKISEKCGDRRGASYAFGNMGKIYFGKGDYARSMEYYEKQLTISEELGYRRGISSAFGDMGNLYYHQGDYSCALKHYKKQLKTSEELGDNEGISIAIGNIGSVYKKACDYEQAEACYDRAISMTKKLHHKVDYCLYLHNKAELCFFLKRFREAEILIKESRSITEEIKNPQLSFNVSILSSKIKYVLYDKKKSIATLENLLSQTEDEIKIAVLNYELWKMKRLEEKTSAEAIDHGEKALEIYRTLYQKTPNIEYKERAEELTITASDFPVKQEFVSDFIEIITQLNSNLPLSGLLRKIVDLSIRFINASRGFLLLYSPDGRLQVEVARDRKQNDIDLTLQPDFRISQTLVDKVIKEGKPLFVPDISEMEDLASAESVVEMQLQSAMCIPLGRRQGNHGNGVAEKRRRFFPARTELLGILYVDSRESTEKNRFKGENLNLLQAIADQASIALVNTLLYEKSNIDSLTGLYLQPYFEDSLRSELVFHKTHNLPLCIMMINIDFFKNIIDAYGHQAGDVVLRSMGEIFIRTFRATDLCARRSGDEFAVMLPNTSSDEIEQIAEKIINAVSSFDFPCSAVTLSFGISEYPGHGEDIQALLKCADEALYAAKISGRNSCRVWNVSYASMKQSHVTDVLTGDPIKDYRNVGMLLKSIDEAASTLDLTELINRVTYNLLEITGSERCILMLLNHQDELEVKAAHNSKGEELKGDLHYSQSICQNVLEKGCPVCLNDISDEMATESQMNAGLRSAMSVPLHVKSKQLGVFYVDSRQTVKQFTSADLSIFSAIVSQLAFAVENSRLYEETIKAGKVKERLLEEEIIDLHRKLSGEARIIGKSKSMEKVFSLLNKVVETDTTVLLVGETGTGKELIARAIHKMSFRKANPFVIVDCGSIPSELLESELFGHEKGAFTGAYDQKTGLFEIADSGTIFLDEIGSLPLPLQPKLLRVIQEKDIRRVGGTERINVNVRIIAASNKNLKELVNMGKFREDLYYRLSVFPIMIPPLRKRDDDIMLLAQYFLGKFGRNRDLNGFTQKVEESLK
ncbi:sigma 54-interacting transcriptional regulator, partial [bacterium]|nr:sigma 54-interacting transcriptional regulator [bacterium]